MLIDEKIEKKEETDVKTFLDVENSNNDDIAGKFQGAFNEDDYIDVPPDGGWTAWLCCFAVSCMNFATWGGAASFSIFLDFYLTNDVFTDATSTDYAMIGGLVVFFGLGLLPFVSIILLKFGYRITISLGIIIQLVGYIGAAYSKNIHQLYFTQGVLVGVSMGCIFGANVIVLPSWFLKKRAIANGFTHFGLGAGAVAYSLTVNKLIEKTNHQKWALITVGLISTAICLTSMLLVKVRIPKNATINKNNKSIKVILKTIFDYNVWYSFPLQLASFWAVGCQLAYTILMFSLSNYATSLGFNKNQATIISVVFGVGQAFGRPGMGIFSELIGRVNFSIFCSVYSIVMVFGVWINIEKYYSLVIFSIFSGFFAGIASVNIVPLVVDVVGLDKYPSGLGYANTLAAITCLIAEVIGLNLRDYSLKNPYFHCQLLVGCAYVIASLILLPYREWRVRRMIQQLKDSNTSDEVEKQRYNDLYYDKSIWGYLKRMFYFQKV
ncbi:hypothetical protein WICMUC_000011 [Wickerhamomyces mucosus]|uniref:Major facilitator superfamily (MFS) profile domain-containing protein n=1 Tax=Wickerhamomyces mucosus TaxID=1378264 RepID=A0A9P8Q0P9_9ASCO|nr:hypothetical protein WICMUC_000011 [Wickerhamomyces mucosus]